MVEWSGREKLCAYKNGFVSDPLFYNIILSRSWINPEFLGERQAYRFYQKTLCHLEIIEALKVVIRLNSGSRPTLHFRCLTYL